MAPRSLFITGTDTDVGKTFITAALAAAWRGEVTAVKPVASGSSDGEPGDAERIARAAGHTPKVFTSWSLPVSPHRAALAEERPLDLEAFLAWIDALPRPLLLEGVGGWRVPLTTAPLFDVSDLATRVQLPVLVVAANRLGVLSHTRLTVEAVRAAGLEVVGVVLNDVHAADDEASRAHNLTDLKLLLDVPVVAADHEPDDGDLEALGRRLIDGLFTGTPSS